MRAQRGHGSFVGEEGGEQRDSCGCSWCSLVRNGGATNGRTGEKTEKRPPLFLSHPVNNYICECSQDGGLICGILHSLERLSVLTSVTCFMKVD